MIAVVYRFSIESGQFDLYQQHWQTMVDFLQANRGAIGSVLHRVGRNEIMIYSNWPDRQTYEQSWPDEDNIKEELPEDIALIALEMRGCIVGDVDYQVMDVIHKK